MPNPREERPAGRRQQLQQLLEQHAARYVTVAFADLQGQLRGKTVAAGQLLGAAESGFPFAATDFLLDFGDHELFPEGYLTRDLPIADTRCELDLDNPRLLPFEERDSRLMFFAGFAAGTQGGSWDPRRLYQRMEHRAGELGLVPTFAFEYEFRIFDETPESLRSKGFQSLKLINPVSTYGGVMHQGQWSDFFRDLRAMCDAMEIPVASTHWELAASMGEVALLHSPGLRTVDDATLFKTHAKTLASKHEVLLSFMARPIAGADGQSGHVHFSLADRNGNALFHDAADEHGMARAQRHFIGGLQKLLPELLLMMAPNINSFKRLVPGIFAPTNASWGVDNRTCAVRVIKGGPGSQRLELRVPGSDTNPYLVAAALLAAGLHGLKQEIEPSAPVTGSGYRRSRRVPASQRFPESFLHAIERFQRSAFARDAFGDDFVEMFSRTRHAQAQQFAQMITDKELERFLELA